MSAGRGLLQPSRLIYRCFSTKPPKVKAIKKGQPLPNIVVYENNPANEINIAEAFKGKKAILFSVPGAFSPGCSLGHIPEYLQNHAKFQAEGFTDVACISVNDPFVMEAWGKQVDPEGKIRMLADMKCEFTKAIGMELDASSLLGNVRSKRYFMLLDDGVVSHINLEPQDTGLACLLCIQTINTKLKQQQKKTATNT